MKLSPTMGMYVPDMDEEIAIANMLEWEKKGQKAIDLCKNQNVCVQAGGNVGYFPIQLAKYFKLVYTFEPSLHCYECLVENVKQPNVIYKYAGLGNKDGWGSVKKERASNYGATQIEYSKNGFEMLAIDNMGLEALDLLWLDVEGMEWEIIEGAINTIATHSPVIIVENNGLTKQFPADLDGSKEFVAAMEKLGYERACRIMRDDFYVPRGGA